MFDGFRTRDGHAVVSRISMRFMRIYADADENLMNIIHKQRVEKSLFKRQCQDDHVGSNMGWFCFTIWCGSCGWAHASANIGTWPSLFRTPNLNFYMMSVMRFASTTYLRLTIEVICWFMFLVSSLIKVMDHHGSLKIIIVSIIIIVERLTT